MNSTKSKILSVATELFAKHGYSETSAQMIADHCQIAQTTVFYHFKSKEVLLRAIIDQAITHNRSLYQAKAVPETNAREQLKTRLLSNLNWAYEFPQEAQVLIMLFNFTKTNIELRDLVTQVIDEGRGLVEQTLMELNEAEGLDLNVKLLAIEAQQLVNGMMFQILVRTDRDETFKQAIKNTERWIERLA